MAPVKYLQAAESITLTARSASTYCWYSGLVIPATTWLHAPRLVLLPSVGPAAQLPRPLLPRRRRPDRSGQGRGEGRLKCKRGRSGSPLPSLQPACLASNSPTFKTQELSSHPFFSSSSILITKQRSCSCRCSCRPHQLPSLTFCHPYFINFNYLY